MKHCYKCGEWKYESEFYKNRSKPSGLSDACKNCAKKTTKNWYWEDIDRSKLSNKKASLKRNYDLSLEDYNIMFNEHDNVCAICGGTNKSGRPLCIDHDHETGKIRGLLCINCNKNLGVLENEFFVSKALNYLRGVK